jgi:hypothetical protein
MTIQSVNHLFRLLDDADWLASCGQPVPDPKVRVVASRDAALGVIADNYTRYYLHEQGNLLSEDVANRSMDAYRAWNDFVEGVRPDVEDVVTRKLAGLTPGAAPEKSLVDRLNWIVLGAALEIYYRHYSGRDFSQTMVFWLTRGHLPLGWESGDYPQGRAVIF